MGGVGNVDVGVSQGPRGFFGVPGVAGPGHGGSRKRRPVPGPASIAGGRSPEPGGGAGQPPGGAGVSPGDTGRGWRGGPEHRAGPRPLR